MKKSDNGENAENEVKNDDTKSGITAVFKKINLKTVVSCLLIVLLLGNMLLSVKILRWVSPSDEPDSSGESGVQEYDETMDGFDETQDGFPIADKYVILPTKAISNAYKTGDTSKLSEKSIETLEMAKEIISAVIKDGMSDYEKEKAIYLWITSNIDFNADSLLVIPTSTQFATPHDVLKNRCAVCVGFATTFRMFMEMLDIECKIVHNKDLSHSWNLVFLDGEWYSCDLYYQKKKGADFEFFNMNDTLCALDHDWENSLFPAAEGYESSERYINKINLENIYALPSSLYGQISSGCNYFAFDVSDFDATVPNDKAACDYMMNTVLTTLQNSVEYQDCRMSWTWSPAGITYLLVVRFYPEDTEASVSGELDEETVNSIDEAVNNGLTELTPVVDEAEEYQENYQY